MGAGCLIIFKSYYDRSHVGPWTAAGRKLLLPADPHQSHPHQQRLRIASPRYDLQVHYLQRCSLFYSGSQKFDENRIPINAEFVESGSGLHALPITSCRLNFYVPSLIKGRKTEFILRLIQHEGKEDYELGDFAIDINDLVDQFKKENVSRHEIKANFSEDYELEFEIYVDTNRVALEKNIREKKTDRAIKSPLRQRKEPRDEGTSGRKNLTQEEKPSRDQEPTPKEEPAEPLREEEAEPAKEEKVEAQPTPEVEPIPEP